MLAQVAAATLFQRNGGNLITMPPPPRKEGSPKVEGKNLVGVYVRTSMCYAYHVCIRLAKITPGGSWLSFVDGAKKKVLLPNFPICKLLGQVDILWWNIIYDKLFLSLSLSFSISLMPIKSLESMTNYSLLHKGHIFRQAYEHIRLHPAAYPPVVVYYCSMAAFAS